MTCQQLKAMLESCPRPEQALRLLLRHSRSHPVTIAKEAAAKQGKQGQTAAAAAAHHVDPPSDDDDADEDDSDPDFVAAADSDWEKQHEWLALPRDVSVQGAKAGVVPDADPRVPLRGQKGIWAIQNLPEGYLIGEGGRSMTV